MGVGVSLKLKSTIQISKIQDGDKVQDQGH